MTALRESLLIAAVLAVGLIAGLFCAFAYAVMPGLAQTDDRVFVSSMQRINVVIVNPLFLLLFFGGALANGLLGALRPIDVAGALLILLIIRPVTGMIGLGGMKATLSERLTISFFGIRGIGSFYYLAYGLNHIDDLTHAARLWAIVGLVVLLSIVMHGLTVTPIMRKLDLTHGRDPDADDAVPPPGDVEAGSEEVCPRTLPSHS